MGIIATSAQKIGAFRMLSCSAHATHKGGTTAMSTLTGVTASYSTVAQIPAMHDALFGVIHTNPCSCSCLICCRGILDKLRQASRHHRLLNSPHGCLSTSLKAYLLDSRQQIRAKAITGPCHMIAACLAVAT